LPFVNVAKELLLLQYRQKVRIPLISFDVTTEHNNTHPQQDTNKLQATYGNTGCRDGILGKVLEGCNDGVHGVSK
jgi:hypothetical protein